MGISAILYIELVILVSSALYSDLKERRIYNTVTFPAIFIGLITNMMIYGIQGLVDGIKGMAVVLILLIIPFIIRGIGGGDVKLIMSIGAIMGLSFVVRVIVYTFIVGAIISLGIIIYFKKFKESMSNIKKYILCTFLIQNVIEIDNREQSVYFPYSVAIAIGVLLGTVKIQLPL